MKKVPFVTLDKLQEITAQFPTPFHLYDEKGIRECKGSERSICME